MREYEAGASATSLAQQYGIGTLRPSRNGSNNTAVLVSAPKKWSSDG
ncbi:MAG: hypothetical protein IPJ90_15790 [Anaerolineaceae bacterium]|nr:hypothetical protein [Anaerolineaceae bacterium]